MKIYLDYIFLENLIVNAVIIFQTIRCINIDIKVWKKFLWAICDAIVACIIYIRPEFNSYIINIIVTTVIIVLVLKPKSVIKCIKYMITYYYIYIVYMGIIIFSSIFFNIHLEIYLNKILLYIFSAVICKYITDKMWIMLKSKNNYLDLVYTLNIQNNNIPVFLDTGNKVYDYTNNSSVIFLDNSLKDKINLENYKLVEFEINTVSGTDIKIGYIINNLKITKDKEEYVIDKVIICFSSINDTPEKYSGIIGYELYLRNLNGGV